MSGDSEVVIPNIAPIKPIVPLVPPVSVASFPMNSSVADQPAVQSIPFIGRSNGQSSDRNLDHQGFEIAPYTEKSFVLRGNGTKEFRGNLMSIGGKWNTGLVGGPGWIFSNNKRQNLDILLSEISSGQAVAVAPPARKPRYQHPSTQPMFVPGMMGVSQPQQLVQPQQSTFMPGQVSLSSPAGGAGGGHQTVQWSVFRPSIGMKAQVTLSGQARSQLLLEVNNAEQDQMGNVLTVQAFNPANGVLYIIGIWNGEWQIRGVLEAHTIFFKFN